MLLTSNLNPGDVEDIVADVSRRLYSDNITCSTRYDGQRRDGRYKVRFTLATHDSFAHGSRTASNGRHMPKASWQAHRDVMCALYRRDPNAVLVTGLATYRSSQDFYDTFEATGERNCGSRMEPMALRDTAV